MNERMHIGYAGDLMMASEKYFALTKGVSSAELMPLITICDLFLVYDKVLFRADIMTIMQLLNAFTDSDLSELIKTDRISFYLPKYNNTGLNKGETGEAKLHDRILSLKGSFIDSSINEDKVISIVFDNLMPAKTEENFEEFEIKMKDVFYGSFEKDTFISRDTEIGFEQTLAKIRELWGIGISSIYYDWEFHRYLDRCEKAASLKNIRLDIKQRDPADSIIDTLHYFKNIPSVTQLIYKSEKPVHFFLDVINSHEASDLRNWLKTHMHENIDVRDLYMKATSKLPSKDEWIDWFRFGSVSVISTILAGMITADPTLQFLIGTGIGAADKIWGDKAINMTASGYNPDNWVNFIQRK